MIYGDDYDRKPTEEEFLDRFVADNEDDLRLFHKYLDDVAGYGLGMTACILNATAQREIDLRESTGISCTPDLMVGLLHIDELCKGWLLWLNERGREIYNSEYPGDGEREDHIFEMVRDNMIMEANRGRGAGGC